MRLKSRCIVCQVEVRYRDVIKLFPDEEQRYRYMMEVLNLLYRYAKDNRDPAPVVATRIFRYLKEVSGNLDPYREEKAKANQEGVKILSELRKVIEQITEPERRLDFAVRVALLGNSLDFGVAGYRPPSLEELVREVDTMSVRGKFPLIRKRRVAYLLDNAGEAALDRLLARVLREFDNEVVAVVKGGAFQNDITISEVEQVGLRQDFDDVVSTGTDAASVFLDEVSQEVRELLRSCDVILAKGMAHFEYLTEVEHVLNKPIIYMMKAKCAPIAEEVGAQVGEYVITVHGSVQD